MISIDSSTPPIVGGPSGGTGEGSLVSASFTPPDASLVLVVVGAGWSTTAVSIGCSDSGSHSWNNPVTAQGTTGAGGCAAIFYQYFARSPGAIAITNTFTGWTAGNGGGMLSDILVFLGAASDHSTAGKKSSVVTTGTTTGTLSIITTKANSWVWGLSDNASSSYAWTPNSATQADGSAWQDTTDSITLVPWNANHYTGTPGATTLGGNWANSSVSNSVAFEILPAPDLPYPPMLVNAQAIRSAYL